MNYTLNQLNIFLKVCQLESITKAAEELHLTQPAVSIQLKNFQDQFDIPLTEVVGRKIFITDFGKEIASAAEVILNEVSAINYKTMLFKGQIAGRLKIASVSTGKYVLPYFLSPFLASHKGVELNMDVTNKEKVLTAVENNEIDFALMSIVPDRLNVDMIELMANKLYIVKSPNYQFEDDNMSKALATMTIILREKGSGTRQVMEKYLNSHQIKYFRKIELTSNEAVKQALIAGIGYSIMPLIGIKNELINGDLEIVKHNDFPLKTMWTLVWPKGKNHSPVAAKFLEFIKSQKQVIMDSKFAWYEQY